MIVSVKYKSALDELVYERTHYGSISAFSQIILDYYDANSCHVALEHW